ncbi:MAG: choice-of-anchor T family protein, partial [Poseidonia sp.]
MSAWKRVVALMGIYLCSLLVVAVPASAQVSGAAVSMTCAPGQIQVEVKPGATLTGYTTCTVSNPTAYVEKVAIQVTSDGLATAAPGDMYVGAGQEVDFQVVVRANPYMQMQSRQLTVSAQVQELNNLPPPNTASSQVNALINIMQFSIVQVEAVEPFVQLMPKTDKNFQFKVYNFGNQ